MRGEHGGMSQHRSCARILKVTSSKPCMAQIIWFLLFLGQTSLVPYQNLLLEPFIPADPSFFRTFPAAIAGQGNYFHYDVDTKEAVSF